jgi:hypothetical protein
MTERKGNHLNQKRSYARKLLRAEIEDVKAKVVCKLHVQIDKCLLSSLFALACCIYIKTQARRRQ